MYAHVYKYVHIYLCVWCTGADVGFTKGDNLSIVGL